VGRGAAAGRVEGEGDHVAVGLEQLLEIRAVPGDPDLAVVPLAVLNARDLEEQVGTRVVLQRSLDV